MATMSRSPGINATLKQSVGYYAANRKCTFRAPRKMSLDPQKNLLDAIKEVHIGPLRHVVAFVMKGFGVVERFISSKELMVPLDEWLPDGANVSLVPRYTSDEISSDYHVLDGNGNPLTGATLVQTTRWSRDDHNIRFLCPARLKRLKTSIPLLEAVHKAHEGPLQNVVALRLDGLDDGPRFITWKELTIPLDRWLPEGATVSLVTRCSLSSVSPDHHVLDGKGNPWSPPDGFQMSEGTCPLNGLPHGAHRWRHGSTLPEYFNNHAKNMRSRYEEDRKTGNFRTTCVNHYAYELTKIPQLNWDEDMEVVAADAILQIMKRMENERWFKRLQKRTELMELAIELAGWACSAYEDPTQRDTWLSVMAPYYDLVDE